MHKGSYSLRVMLLYIFFKEIQGGSNMTGTDLCVNSMGKSVSVGDTLPHTVVGVCGEFQRTGRFLQRGI